MDSLIRVLEHIKDASAHYTVIARAIS